MALRRSLQRGLSDFFQHLPVLTRKGHRWRFASFVRKLPYFPPARQDSRSSRLSRFLPASLEDRESLLPVSLRKPKAAQRQDALVGSVRRSLAQPSRVRAPHPPVWQSGVSLPVFSGPIGYKTLKRFGALSLRDLLPFPLGEGGRHPRPLRPDHNEEWPDGLTSFALRGLDVHAPGVETARLLLRFCCQA